MSVEGVPINISAHIPKDQLNRSKNANNASNSELPYRREIVGSNAFNLEYFSYTSSEEMYDDIVSYLGEYRFQLKKFDYEMVYARGKDGKWAIRDTARGESLGTKAKRVLEERSYRGDSITREIEEEKGIKKLDDSLRFAESGDKIRWMSPPGDAADGYDAYGFLYEGNVEKNIDGTFALHMSAIRLEGELDAYNKSLTRLTGVYTNNTKAEEFLSGPVLVKGEKAGEDPYAVLSEEFGFSKDPAQDVKFQKIIQRMRPLIWEVIGKIKYAGQHEKVLAFNTLENYFLRQKEMIEMEEESGGKVMFLESFQKEDLSALYKRYGHAAPAAKGSCGATGGSSVSLTVGGGVEIDSLLKAVGLEGKGESYSFDKVGDCRVCGLEEIAVGPCDICKSCDGRIQLEKKLNPFKEAA